MLWFCTHHIECRAAANNGKGMTSYRRIQFILVPYTIFLFSQLSQLTFDIILCVWIEWVWMRVNIIEWLCFQVWNWKERKMTSFKWPKAAQIPSEQKYNSFKISVFQFQRLSSALTASLIWDSLRGEDIAGWGGTILGFLLHKWEIAKDIFDKILLMLFTLWVKGARGSQREYQYRGNINIVRRNNILLSASQMIDIFGSDLRPFCTLLHWSLAANYLTRNCCPHQSSDKEMK